MRIHFSKLLRIFATFFLVWLSLFVAKIFGFNFALDLFYLFLVVLALFLFSLTLEIIANRKFIWHTIKAQKKRKEEEFFQRSRKIQKKIISLSGLFSGNLGQDFALIIGWIFSGLFIIKETLRVLFFTKYHFLAFSLFGILFEIFYLEVSVDAILIILLIVWLTTVYLFKFKGEISIKIALVLLPFCPYFLSRKMNFLAEKVAVWVFLFLAVGVIQFVFEQNNQLE